jgi:hypothetical protein
MPNANEETQNESNTESGQLRLSKGKLLWSPGVLGGVSGGLVAAFVVLSPIAQTALANWKEIALVRAKVSEERIAYLEKRIADLEKDCIYKWQKQ